MENSPDGAAHPHEERVLHVYRSQFDDVAFVVSPATMRAAAAADNAPYLADFGDLRRSGDIDELTDRLDSALNINDYIGAIERFAGRTPSGGDLADRLKAVDDVEFDGDDNFPSDTTDFRSDDEIAEEPDQDFRGYEIIANATADDVPKDIFDEFGGDSYGDSPAFSGQIDSHVAADRLEAMSTALEARGYTVVRE